MTDDTPAVPPAPAPGTLGEQLSAAREASGLDLSEISRSTHVRREYLLALESGSYSELPEPVYTRNFVRLFAQAVGLPAAEALEAYARERQEPEPVSTRTAAARTTKAATVVAAPTQKREKRRAPPGSGPALGGLIPTLLLVFIVVGLAVWGFNSTLFKPGVPAPATDPAPSTPVAAEPEIEPPATARLSVTSTPPGARVFVDEFPLDGTTPITDAPVTARSPRMIRLELEGYEPAESKVDLSFDRNMTFSLIPAAAEIDAEAAPAGSDVEAETDQPAATAGSGHVALSVTDLTWLEVYSGTERSGTPLVYTTATPGQSYRFDLPIFVRVGNAAGVDVTVNGSSEGSLGSSGQVLERTFTE